MNCLFACDGGAPGLDGRKERIAKGLGRARRPDGGGLAFRGTAPASLGRRERLRNGQGLLVCRHAIEEIKPSGILAKRKDTGGSRLEGN